MEAGAAWAPPCDFELAHWRRELGDNELANRNMEPAVWAPGLPVEPVFTDIFGNWFQTSAPNCTRGLMFEHQAATQNHPIEPAAQDFEVDFHTMEMKAYIHAHATPIHVFEKEANEFKNKKEKRNMTIHRYPASIKDLDEKTYTVPTVVAIGPYHHGRDHLRQVEKVKHVAAYHCIRDSGSTVQEMYDAIVSVAHDARDLYDDDQDVVAGIGDGDFLPMMFFDACFLVQYMLACIASSSRAQTMDPLLYTFFYSNRDRIDHDVVLLENQLPWRVVKAVMRFRPVPMEEFIASWDGYLQDRMDPKEKAAAIDGRFDKAPHLLGLLRYCFVGRRRNASRPTIPESKSTSFSVSATELADLGIKITANETKELIHMGLNNNGFFTAKLSLAPLYLTDSRANLLINIAALEICTSFSDYIRFEEAGDEDSAVCSYLLLLAMLVNRMEDVHELRTKRILIGGAGLVDKDAFNFFRALRCLPRGFCYFRVILDIANYKADRPVRSKVHAFFHKNMKTIITVVTTIAAFFGILGALKSLKVIN